MSADPVQAFRAAILAALGHAPEQIEPGKLHRFPTSDKRGDDAGWCKLFEDLRGGVFGCNRAGISEIWQADDRRAMTREQHAAMAREVAVAAAQRERDQRAQWTENGKRISHLLTQCLPLAQGDPVMLYLQQRGFGGLWPLPHVLRFHPALPYWHDGKKIGIFPAMVALMTAPGGRTVALHRTYLTGDGKKADVPSPRKLTSAAGPLVGASIRLFNPANSCLGISEGIETALAARCASGLPTVAAYSAGSLAAYRWPASVLKLVIFADADKAGQQAAGALQVRALTAGLLCSVLTPSEVGTDWADVWINTEATT